MSKPTNKKLHRLIVVPPSEMTDGERQYLAPRAPKKRAATKPRRRKKR